MAKSSGSSAGLLLKILLVMSVLGPATLFAAAAYVAYGTAFREAEDRVSRGADVAEEHAAKVLETHRLLAAHALTLVGGLADAEIRQREAELHQDFAELIGGIPQVLDIWAFDRTGRPLASGKSFPIPPGVNVADRPYFTVHVAGETGLAISGLME